MMGEYSVYMHVNKINGKRYIGITSQTPSSRWKGGLGYKKQRRFFSAIVSYGWNNFDHIILRDNLSKEEAEKMEFELIQEYHSNDLRYGYNIENGGVTNKLSDEQKEHLRHINLGKHHSPETRKKMSDASMGASRAWLTGRHLTEETKKKMSASRSGAKNPRASKVYQFNLEGNLIAMYSCMNDAKKALGVRATAHISQCCCGMRNKAYGFRWSYNPEPMPYNVSKREVARRA